MVYTVKGMPCEIVVIHRTVFDWNGKLISSVHLTDAWATKCGDNYYVIIAITFQTSCDFKKTKAQAKLKCLCQCIIAYCIQLDVGSE